MIWSFWRMAPHVWTLGTYPSRSDGSGRTSGSHDRARTLEGSLLSSRNAPIEYFLTGPTPWVSNSQPLSSSIGDPQLPICTNSHGNCGFKITTPPSHEYKSSE